MVDMSLNPIKLNPMSIQSPALVLINKKERKMKD